MQEPKDMAVNSNDFNTSLRALLFEHFTELEASGATRVYPQEKGKQSSGPCILSWCMDFDLVLKVRWNQASNMGLPFGQLRFASWFISNMSCTLRTLYRTDLKYI